VRNGGDSDGERFRLPRYFRIEDNIELEVGSIDSGFCPPTFIAPLWKLIEQVQVVVLVSGQVHGDLLDVKTSA
jgi:hypothetical protein